MVTLLRHAHSHIISKGFKGLLFFLWNLLSFSACSHHDRPQVDELNGLSYACHYRNLDSAAMYAVRAYDMSEHYGDGRAEALNNMAFVHMAGMDYDVAKRLLDEVASCTDNQVELLVCDVQQMRLCQRMSRNREFYDYCERARMRMARINDERAGLSGRMHKRMIYAETEFHIVNSIYYYYVGLERRSAESLLNIDIDGEIQKDTVQYLSYLYNVGAGGIISDGQQKDIIQKEFESLLKCYLIAAQHGYTVFEANTLEAMAEHLVSDESRTQLLQDNSIAVNFVVPDSIDDNTVPEWMAVRALQLFSEYGDVYQIAGAHRTLASCFMERGDYNLALYHLEKALENTKIEQAPDLVASIREQLSVVYSAINDKPASDYNRNIYIELQEKTRQDRYLESRAGKLNKSALQLNIMIIAVATAILLLVFMLCLFYYLNRKRSRKLSMDSLLMPLREWQAANVKQTADLEDRIEKIHEEYTLGQIRVRNGERRSLENRAKVSLVCSIIPFIDRIINEVNQLSSRNEDSKRRSERYAYVAELAGKIEEYNDVLTHWIQLRRGHIDLHIESFPLQPLFDIVARSKTGFVMSGLQFTVGRTDAWVKADRVLTLFMINTLADNARKFTPSGGSVKVSAYEENDYVEISVEDTGRGMSAEQLDGIFDHKVYNGHGFGLMNCRGIMEKYRKISRIFSVCILSAVSEEGHGSRFFFRLPKGIARTVVFVLLMSVAVIPANGVTAESNLSRAKSFADSAYFSNIDGTYENTMRFADSCRKYLNLHYRELYPDGQYFMQREGDISLVFPEIRWFQDSVNTNYNIILDIRNESAVAALALHQWRIYAYNNKIYTLLFKEMSADNTLADYCRTMQQSQTNKTVAIIVLILVLIMILPAYYMLYYRHRLYYRFCVERVKSVNEILLSDAEPTEKLQRISPLANEQYPEELQEVVDRIDNVLRDAILSRKEQFYNIELAEDECRRTEYEDNNLHIANSISDNCLSALKHETRYYPSRIRQLVDGGENDMEAMKEIVVYYRDIYSILSRQAVRQTESLQLALSAVPIHDIVKDVRGEKLCVLGNRNLLEYLFEILRKQNGRLPLDVTAEAKDDRYVQFSVKMTGLHIDERKASDLFVPSVDNIPYLLCRQIVRDHSESANRRGCGILATVCRQETIVKITLPRYS